MTLKTVNEVTRLLGNLNNCLEGILKQKLSKKQRNLAIAIGDAAQIMQNHVIGNFVIKKINRKINHVRTQK